MADPAGISANPLTISQLQSSGLNRADLAGLFGASMQLNPYMAGLGAATALPSALQAMQQGKLLKQLQKEGPEDVTPQAFQQYQAALQNQANNAQIAGYGTALENIARAQSTGLGNVYKTAINPSQALRGALALNQQGIAARNQLAIQGSQAQQARQAAANQAMLQRGQWQEKGRQEYNQAVSALRGAKAQNWNNFIQGLAGAGLNSFTIGSAKKPVENVNTKTMDLSRVSGIGDFPQYEAPMNPYEQSVYNTTG
jgi:hypothetical protein